MDHSMRSTRVGRWSRSVGEILWAMRTDGIPPSLRETAKNPLQVNALLYCIMSHAANADLRPFFRADGLRVRWPVLQDDRCQGRRDCQKLARRGRSWTAGRRIRTTDIITVERRLTRIGTGPRWRLANSAGIWRLSETHRSCNGFKAVSRRINQCGSASSLQISDKNGNGFLEKTPHSQIGHMASRRRGYRCFALLLTGSGKWRPAPSPARSYPGIIEVSTKPLAPLNP